MTEFAIKIGSLEEAQQCAFKLAVVGLASQNWEACVAYAHNQVQSCAWHLGKPGKHCAIGWLIPWDIQLEAECFQTVEDAMGNEYLFPEFHAWAKAASEDEVSSFTKFLSVMQNRHDQRCSPADMRLGFLRIGEEFNLAWPEGVQ